MSLAVLEFTNVHIYFISAFDTPFRCGVNRKSALVMFLAVLEFTNVLVPIASLTRNRVTPKQSVQGIETTADTDCFLVKENLEGVNLPKEPRPGYQVSPLLEHGFV